MSFEQLAIKSQGGVHKHHGKPTDPVTPFRGIFAGQSGSGKTWQLSKWLCDLAKRKGKACLFDKIIWVAPEYSLKQKGALQVVRRCWSGHFDALEPTQTAELDALMKKHDEAGFQFLVVMDDCMAIIQKSRPLSSFYDQLFCAVRHLGGGKGGGTGGSIISLEQRIFCGNRTRRLQSSLYCVWKMMGKSEFAAFARQVAGSKKDAELLTRAYSNILRKDPHGFITIDLSNPDENRRVREGWTKGIPQLSHI